MLLFDGHVHSATSDGTDAAGDLPRLAREAGVAGIALMDHDTVDGWAAAADAAGESGVALILGAELSASYRGSSSHLLAYLPDPEDPTLLSTMKRIRGAREERLRAMVEAVSQDYAGVNWETLQRLTSDEAKRLTSDEAKRLPWGRPHLADLLVTLGHVASRDEAFASILAPGGTYFVPQWAPGPVEMVEVVRGAGGVPVLAHPLSRRRQRPLPDSVIGEMAEAGLFGLERDHREHDGAARAEIDRIARRYGLAVTGGSDYHGAGKENRLGENSTSFAVIERIAEQGAAEAIGLDALLR